MITEKIDTQAAWSVSDLSNSNEWRFQIAPAAQSHLREMVQSVYEQDRPFFDYSPDEFDLGPAKSTISAAMNMAHHGFGIALLSGLPRTDMAEQEFELLNWAIGLHTGVARPQGLASQYMSQVRNVGTDYRAATGRGYSSNAKLDFHADGCDLVTLGCYNKAKSGGQSMVSSSMTAWEILCRERPDLAEIACHDMFYFSRQNEQAEDEGPHYAQPLFDFEDGRLFGKWNRNRVVTGQKLDGVPALTPAQIELTDLLDEILRRPDVMYTMHLEPGDLQILNNHFMLHSRTDYVDHDEPENKRLLCRVWLAPPDSVPLPKSWKEYFRSVEPGTIRGGIRGKEYDDACAVYETRQAVYHGMPTNQPIQIGETA